jgi:2-oxoisovalerate dehydrogenase E2 component (dihydrolipoyl transacylase)
MAERVFLLPDPGEGLEEAEVVAWLVAEGDTVELNQPFVEVETAKATVEIPSPYAGIVARLHAAEGDTVRVGAPLVTFEVEGVAEERGPVAATPAVRRLAKELGVDLSDVPGTGPGGRVTNEDLSAAAQRTGKIQVVAADTDAELVPASPIRRATAERMRASTTIPQVTTFRTVECSELERYRRAIDVSPLPVFLRALADTIARHPMLNASWTDEGILVHGVVNAGIATDTERGLVVPVVRDVVARGVDEVASEIRRLAEAARGGHLTPDEVTGSTISVSNTGSYGSEAGTPLLNPPNAVTVALGLIAPRALVIDGEVQARPACTLSLTFDHRVLDGAAVGRAITDLVDLLQDPVRLRDLPR